MNRELLFWLMSVLLLILPFGMIWAMPASRVREIFLRGLIGVILITLGFGCALMAFVPHYFYLFDAASLSATTFWVMAVMLLLIPTVWVFFLPQSHIRTLIINGLLWLAGVISLVLGIVGAFLPVMPTVPFVLLAAACWGRASPRFHAWLLQTKYFGPLIKNWEEKRAIPKRGKYLAWIMMSISTLGLLISFPQRWYVGVGTGLVCLCVGVWMAKFPDA